MILIPNNIEKKISFLVGAKSAISNTPTSIFNEDRINFLSDLSKSLLADARIRLHPEVASFAYWCRNSNLTRLSGLYLRDSHFRMGLGLTFHICPANVPVNFAFSMAFGLLSGNTCALRLPSKTSDTTNFLLEVIQKNYSSDRYSAMRDALVLLRFDRDDEINQFWMSISDGQMIWGGDETIAHMHQYRVKPRSRQVVFPDRYSICILEPNYILKMDDEKIQILCKDLFNDIYLMDQAACSSPQLFVWVGESDAVELAKNRLWESLSIFAEKKYKLSAIGAVDKYVDLCLGVIGNFNIKYVNRYRNFLYVVGLNNIKLEQHQCRGYYGTVHEVTILNLGALAPVINEKYQTVIVVGVDKSIIREFILTNGLRGIDRVVSVGKAIDMDLIWDGYDIVRSLSRHINF